MGIVIDLRRRYDIRPRALPNGMWEVIDLETYEDDPHSEFHLAGHGDSICEATTDLLEKIAAVAARFEYVEVGGSREQPPEIIRKRIADPDEYCD